MIDGLFGFLVGSKKDVGGGKGGGGDSIHVCMGGMYKYYLVHN